jgi:Cdc6-like AAA superfamily ATPase
MVCVELNTLIVRVARRAENAPPDVLKEAFVPVRSLMASLELPEHQVLFGRRGTGKTHLMRFMQEQRSAEGALAIYLDLRQIGAAEDVFSPEQHNFSQQTTALLVDVVEHVHTGLRASTVRSLVASSDRDQRRA